VDPQNNPKYVNPNGKTNGLGDSYFRKPHLKTMKRRKPWFLDGVFHDFRQPLNPKTHCRSTEIGTEVP